MHQLVDVLNLKILTLLLDLWLQFDLTKILRSPTVQANLPGVFCILLRVVIQETWDARTYPSRRWSTETSVILLLFWAFSDWFLCAPIFETPFLLKVTRDEAERQLFLYIWYTHARTHTRTHNKMYSTFSYMRWKFLLQSSLRRTNFTNAHVNSTNWQF